MEETGHLSPSFGSHTLSFSDHSFLIWKTSVHSSSVDYTYRSAIIFNQSAKFSPTLLAKTPVALFNVFDGYEHQ